MKESYIAAKERWARKIAGKEKPTVRSWDRLPPGQRQVHNFPVLDLGIRPDVPLEKWQLQIHGHVENPVTYEEQTDDSLECNRISHAPGALHSESGRRNSH